VINDERQSEGPAFCLPFIIHHSNFIVYYSTSGGSPGNLPLPVDKSGIVLADERLPWL
jgi:hypothetical protein